MNRFAYRTTGLAIKTLANVSRARINIHDSENIPDGSIIFVINHFTRIETFLMPYHLFKLIKIPVWSLAAAELFVGALGNFLEKVGAVSTNTPDRDRLIIKTLLTGEAAWVIFPEGRMVKNKKIIEKGRYMISYAGGKHPPHTGAATLALRTEFYRQRLRHLSTANPEEAQRLCERFNIDDIDQVLEQCTHIVPVNLTYYPMRAKENSLSKLAQRLVEDLPERLEEEIMTEGSMLLSGVDIDMRFGSPIAIDNHLKHRAIRRDMTSARRYGFDDELPSRLRMRKEALNIMQRYMAAIYSMTTVNHDHLIASALKRSPIAHVNLNNLKRRVYLSTSRKLDQLGNHLHHSLSEDQIHLITDDRYHKMEDLLALAEEKEIITRDGNHLTKAPARFASIFDFHRARVDNPIAVIANEVEPLVNLQRRISRLAWQPGFWLRKKIVRHLMRKTLAQFEEDYTQYFIEGETKPKDVGRPYLIKGGRRRLGILLCHGYMAAPLEVRELAEYLGKKGFWVYVPRLRGHGTSPEDLSIRSYHDWVADMEEGYGVISNICRRVAVGGFSTGAGLALELAARVTEICGVFAVSAPLRLNDFSARLVPAVDMWNKIMAKVHLNEAIKEFVENNPENPHINYFRNPISGVRELERLMDDLESKLPRIQVPTLVVQSQEDPVVNPKSAEQIFKKIGSEDKQFALFNFNRHGILLGEGAWRVHRVIGDFIEHLK